MLPASLIGFVCQPYGVAGIFSFGENHKTRLGEGAFWVGAYLLYNSKNTAGTPSPAVFLYPVFQQRPRLFGVGQHRFGQLRQRLELPLPP